MMNTPRNVATSMPQKTAVPMTFCAPAPAPLASMSGTTPRMKANAVIRMGRKRRRAASSAASCADLPSFSCLTFATSTMRIAFLAARPMSMTSPTWT